MVSIKSKLTNICRIIQLNTIQQPISGIAYKMWMGYMSFMILFDIILCITKSAHTLRQKTIWLCVDSSYLLSIIAYYFALKKFPSFTRLISIISYLQFGFYASEPTLSSSTDTVFILANMCTGGIISTILIYDSISTITEAIALISIFYSYCIASIRLRKVFLPLRNMIPQTVQYVMYGYSISIIISLFFLYDRYRSLRKQLENKKIMNSWQKVMNIIGVAISVEKCKNIAYRNKLFKDLFSNKPISLLMEENNSILNDSLTINDHIYKITKQSVFFSNSLFNIFIASDITSIQKEEERKYTQLLVATVTHELRTPLNIMSQLFTEIDLHASNDKQQEAAKKGMMATALQECLINDILDIAKINSGHFQLNPNKSNIKAITIDVYNLLKIKVDDKVTFNLEIGEGFPNNLIIDERRYKQLIMNLISNSIKFTKEGYISLHLHYSNENLYCSVTDSGIGIPDNEKDNIFKQFGMVKANSQMNTSGTGLGLNLCKKLVTSMGGDITFSSKVNAYTMFTFWIPCKPDNCPYLIQNDSQFIRYLVTNNKCVLNIDDEFMNLSVLNSYAARFGLKHFSFRNAKEALAQMESGRLIVAIAFIDINMPEMSGYDVAKKLRSMNNRLLLIALSGEDKQAIQGNCYQAGFDEIMEKPLKYEEYCSCITKYFGNMK